MDKQDDRKSLDLESDRHGSEPGLQTLVSCDTPVSQSSSDICDNTSLSLLPLGPVRYQWMRLRMSGLLCCGMYIKCSVLWMILQLLLNNQKKKSLYKQGDQTANSRKQPVINSSMQHSFPTL